MEGKPSPCCVFWPVQRGRNCSSICLLLWHEVWVQRLRPSPWASFEEVWSQFWRLGNVIIIVLGNEHLPGKIRVNRAPVWLVPCRRERGDARNEQELGSSWRKGLWKKAGRDVGLARGSETLGGKPGKHGLRWTSNIHVAEPSISAGGMHCIRA